MTIKAWSYSRLAIFEQCRLRAKLAYIDKIPEPERPLPEGKTEHANDRGTRIHEGAEFYVKDNVELLPELKQHFEAEFKALRALFRLGKVSLEGEWGFDRDWTPVDYHSANVWTRIKLDAMVHISKIHGVVIDYKSGRRSGNEIKHAEQMQLYQLAAFLKYPELEILDVELWYTDINELVHMRFTRAQGLRFYNGFDRRGAAITDEKIFPANPNIFSCRYCPYGPGGTGHCTKGVTR